MLYRASLGKIFGRRIGRAKWCFQLCTRNSQDLVPTLPYTNSVNGKTSPRPDAIAFQQDIFLGKRHNTLHVAERSLRTGGAPRKYRGGLECGLGSTRRLLDAPVQAYMVGMQVLHLQSKRQSNMPLDSKCSVRESDGLRHLPGILPVCCWRQACCAASLGTPSLSFVNTSIEHRILKA